MRENITTLNLSTADMSISIDCSFNMCEVRSAVQRLKSFKREGSSYKWRVQELTSSPSNRRVQELTSSPSKWRVQELTSLPSNRSVQEHDVNDCNLAPLIKQRISSACQYRRGCSRLINVDFNCLYNGAQFN
jgi:hypothetical protein